MTTRRFDVIGIGNAVMDVIATVPDEVLTQLGVEKGVMQLVDQPRSAVLTEAIADYPAQLIPGGSVANTLDGSGRMGLATGFLGRVDGDHLGRAYLRETEAAGSAFINPPVADASTATSRSIILVTPDGERSMNTWLGISAELSPADVDPQVFAGGPWLFLEGYLFDRPGGKAAFLKAAEACHANGGQAGIALSDPFCVDRHREDFRRLVAGPMDYVIGNIHEWTALYQTADIEAALEQAVQDCGTVICTRSGEDAILIRGDERVSAPVQAVTPVDATGAGDQFAAGLIYGLATGRDLSTAGRMGCIAAAEVISHIGARAQSDVAALFRAEGLM